MSKHELSIKEDLKVFFINDWEAYISSLSLSMFFSFQESIEGSAYVYLESRLIHFKKFQ